jgi:hypothetical protein
MVETTFDPARNLIIVEGGIAGPLGDTTLRLVLDTRAAESLVVPDIVDALGYSELGTLGGGAACTGCPGVASSAPITARHGSERSSDLGCARGCAAVRAEPP